VVRFLDLVHSHKIVLAILLVGWGSGGGLDSVGCRFVKGVAVRGSHSFAADEAEAGRDRFKWILAGTSTDCALCGQVDEATLHKGPLCNVSRRKFTKEMKLAAVQRLDAGASIAEVARAFEVNPNLLHRWRQRSAMVRAMRFQEPVNGAGTKPKLLNWNGRSGNRLWRSIF